MASASIPTPDLPEDLTKRLPRYASLPAVRIGRLAIKQRFQKRGLGGALLADAARRTLEAAPASYTLPVDAKDDQAADFYRHQGFLPLKANRELYSCHLPQRQRFYWVEINGFLFHRRSFASGAGK